MQLSGRVKTAILTNIVLRKRNPHPHQSICPSLELPEISAIDFSCQPTLFLLSPNQPRTVDYDTNLPIGASR